MKSRLFACVAVVGVLFAMGSGADEVKPPFTAAPKVEIKTLGELL